MSPSSGTQTPFLLVFGFLDFLFFFLVMSEELARCINLQYLEGQVIFGQGFLPLALDNSISNCRAAVLVLVHPGYFISPVPTISGERSPIRHMGRRPMAHYQLLTGEKCFRQKF